MQLLLRALRHPDAGSPQPCTLRGLVFWIEDRKIRFRPEEDRQDLSDDSATGWSEAVSKVLRKPRAAHACGAAMPDRRHRDCGIAIKGASGRLISSCIS